MKRIIRVAGVLLVSAMMLAGTLGIAVAEPGKNQIRVLSTCDNGAQYDSVIKGEGDIGHIEGTNDLVVIKRYTVSYVDATTGEPIATNTVDNGQKTGVAKSLVQCTGVTTFNHWQLGDVTATFDFEAFITPHGN